MSGIWPYVGALIPSVGVGFLFYVVMKNMIEGDRNERLAQARWEAEQDRERAEAYHQEDFLDDEDPADISEGDASLEEADENSGSGV